MAPDDDTDDTDATTDATAASDAPAPAGGERVKDLVAKSGASDELDPDTQAQLARWFGLPSYEELEERGEAPPGEPDELAERRKLQARAAAAVDPELLDTLYARSAAFGSVELVELHAIARIDPSISALDPMMLGKVDAIAEPRLRELPYGLEDALAECTPQAVLRDLHRPELYFQKHYEVDPALAAMLMVDPLGEARALVAIRHELELPEMPLAEARRSLAELARAKRAPWSEIRTPTRRVVEEPAEGGAPSSVEGGAESP